MVNPSNLALYESVYRQWQTDPNAVSSDWRAFCEGFDLALGHAPTNAVPDATQQIGVVRLIEAYRDIGHFQAHLDPLNPPPGDSPLLALDQFGLRDADLEQPIDPRPFLGLPTGGTLRELLAALRATYCRTIGVEFKHIQDTHIRRWLKDRMEPRHNQPNLPRRQQLRILMTLHYAELFERFLQTKYLGQKRFSLEGAETLIPVLDAIVEKGPDLGVQEFILGMAHRGRLNVLANTLSKPYQEIFAEFEDNFVADSIDGDGDVKYHLGFSSDRVTSRGGRVHLSLSPNPSHLEVVNPVVQGRTRAKQQLFRDTERTRGVPLIIHGDAAFAGQGSVAETLNLAELAGYRVGGTIHVIVNNQIGFTTSPKDARSTTYCTDVAKMIQAPIFHVNAEDPDAAVFVAELALEFRQKFRRDVVIDLYCYRRHGHNEGDEPSFTHPVMYAQIKDRPSVSAIYTETLIKQNVLRREEAQALDEAFQAKLNSAQMEMRAAPPRKRGMSAFTGRWDGLKARYQHEPADTAVTHDTLKTIIDGITQVPNQFKLNDKISKIFETRRKAIAESKPIDWAFAEALAFGALVLEGVPVRLSGQDSRRGTFSQRHAVVYDAQTGERHVPLNTLWPQQAPFDVYDSMLSETAVLGFEYGYSLDDPNTLVMWEAQFGDFVNGAQVIIDQFLSSGESKWQRSTGVVLLLPHGYEGQGPEHSSARLERFLQACAEDNMQVCNLTTPAQYFHVLRRQMKRPFRKPLVIMTPKSLLRHKEVVSPLAELTTGRFHEILPDTTVAPEGVRRVLLCSGKVYYDLAEKRADLKRTDVAIVRVEQFYPLHEQRLQEVLRPYRQCREWAWVQEESQNMGGWSFMEPRLRSLGLAVEYVGRDASASPATGSHKVHEREQKELVEMALGGTVPHLVRAVRPASANGANVPATPTVVTKT
jgi:2-oxoglutarate dehydrogenase E1 component